MKLFLKAPRVYLYPNLNLTIWIKTVLIDLKKNSNRQPKINFHLSTPNCPTSLPCWQPFWQPATWHSWCSWLTAVQYLFHEAKWWKLFRSSFFSQRKVGLSNSRKLARSGHTPHYLLYWSQSMLFICLPTALSILAPAVLPVQRWGPL